MTQLLSSDISGPSVGGALKLNELMTTVRDILGSTLLGTFFGLILYGIILLQFYQYCRTFPSDALIIRALIVTLMILETAHAVMTMHYTYVSLVTDYGDDFKGGIHLPWSFNIFPFVTGLIMICSQLFFIGRVYTIGFRYRIIAGITATLMLLEIPLAIYLVQALFNSNNHKYDGHNHKDAVSLERVLLTGLLDPCIVDTLLTFTLIIVLRRARAGLKRNDGIINFIVTYGINTGILHCILNWACFASFVRAGKSILPGQYIAINVAASRAYALSFLCVLNSREARSSEVFFSSGAYGLKVIERARQRAAAEVWNVPQIPDDEPTSINIRVTTEMEHERKWHRSNENCSETTTSELGYTV